MFWPFENREVKFLTEQIKELKSKHRRLQVEVDHLKHFNFSCRDRIEKLESHIGERKPPPTGAVTGRTQEKRKKETS